VSVKPLLQCVQIYISEGNKRKQLERELEAEAKQALKDFTLFTEYFEAQFT
jgi:hypothetical protein